MPILYEGFSKGSVIYDIETDKYYKITEDHSVTCSMGVCAQDALQYELWDINGEFSTNGHIHAELGFTDAPYNGNEYVRQDGSWVIHQANHTHTYTLGLSCFMDNAGQAIPIGTSFGFIYVPFDCTITGWSILADLTGSMTVDIYKCDYASYPTNSDYMICGTTAPPQITNANKASSTTLTDWTTTAITAGDTIEFYVSDYTDITRATVTLIVTRTI